MTTDLLTKNSGHVKALAEHLLSQYGISIHVYDSCGRLMVETEGTCNANHRDCKPFLRGKVGGSVITHQTEGRCPNGRTVRVYPMLRSSVLFGHVVACSETGNDDERNKHVDAAINAIAHVLMEDASKEKELDSLASELALRYEELELLYELDEHIPLRSYSSKVIEFVTDRACAAIDCTCIAWVADGECRLFWNPKHVGCPTPIMQLEAEHVARTAAESALVSDEPVLLNCVEPDSRSSAFTPDLARVAAAMMCGDKELYGCLVIFKHKANDFTSYDVKLISALARKGTFVIRDCKLYEDLDSLFYDLIRVLVNTIENKDEYTKGHSQRVKVFTVRLGELMGLTRQDIDTLNISGLIHDIGKQGIPDAVLKKEDQLTFQERQLINTHPARGVDLIKHIKQFAPCLPHILHHHERVDGTGYPSGLKGDEIPLGARIIAVADTFDALTSDRCYRSRFSRAEAFEIISNVSGKQLDADITSVLLSNRTEFELHVQGIGKQCAGKKE